MYIATLRECLLITQVKPTSGWRWSVRSWGRSSPPSAKWLESRTTTPDHHLYYQTYFTIIILSGWLETFPHLAWVEVDNLLIGKKLARGHLPCNLSQRWCSLWCWSWIFTKSDWWHWTDHGGVHVDDEVSRDVSCFVVIRAEAQAWVPSWQLSLSISCIEIWNETCFCIF